MNDKIISSRVEFIKRIFFKFLFKSFRFDVVFSVIIIFLEILTCFINFQMIIFTTRRRINNALTSKDKFYSIVLLMSLNFCVKTFVFVVLSERMKTFSMSVKSYLILNANTVKRRNMLI